MSEEKKHVNQPQYAQITRKSIKVQSETVGISDLSDDIAALLAEDVNYRLRAAIQKAGQFMKHAKRKKLTSEDINRALRWSDIEPVYGHSSGDTLHLIHNKDIVVYFAEDREINLVSLATGTQEFEQSGPTYAKAHWVAVEGVQRTTPPGKKISSGVSHKVSEVQMVYYDQMTKAILGNHDGMMKAALEDLRTNNNLSPILPYLINFVFYGVRMVNHDLTQLLKLLQTVKAVIMNSGLNLGPYPYMDRLFRTLLYCILEPLAASINPINDHWALRDTAAHLLVYLVRVWHSPVNQLCQQALTEIRDVFKDYSKPFSSHYGAVVAVTAFGPQAVEAHIYPHLHGYWKHLQFTIKDSSYHISQTKADAYKVHGALLRAAEQMLLHRRKAFLGLDEEPLFPETDLQIDLTTSTTMIGGKNRRTGGGKETKELLTGAGSMSADEHLHSESKPFRGMKQEPMSPCSKLTQSPSKIRKTEISQNISTLELYSDLYEMFGDALAMRLPLLSIKREYVVLEEEPVNLFFTSEQSGEELLESFNVKMEDEACSNSFDMDDDHSYDDNSMPSDDPDTPKVDLRIKSSVNDPTLGIKLTIAKLPRIIRQPDNDSYSSKPSKIKIKISNKSEATPTHEPSPPPKPPTPPPPPPKEDEQIFNYVTLKPRVTHITFRGQDFVAVPCKRLQRMERILLDVSVQSLESKVFSLSRKMKKTGKLKLWKRNVEERPLLRRRKWISRFLSGNIENSI